MQHRFLVLLAAALTLPVLPFVTALGSLDDDAGSGRDAGPDRATAVRLEARNATYSARLTAHTDEADAYIVSQTGWSVVRVTVDSIVQPTFGVTSPSGSVVMERCCAAFMLGPGDSLFVFRAQRVTYAAIAAPVLTDYAFTLVVEAISPDDASSGTDASAFAPVSLGPGKHTGELGPHDPEDTYEVDVRAGERLSVDMRGPFFGVRLPGGVLRSPTSVGNGIRGFDHLAVQDGTVTLVVHPWGPAPTPYEIEIGIARWSDDPAAIPRPAVVADLIASHLIPEGDGVEAVAVGPTGSASWYRVNATGARPIRHGLPAGEYSDVAKDAAGNLYFAEVWDESGIRRIAPTGPAEYVGEHAHIFTFGPDGAMWRRDGRTAVAEDGRSLTFPTPPRSLAFGPDGRLYALLSADRLFRGDVATGHVAEIARPATSPWADMAFDSLGRVYVLSEGHVVRVDPSTGDLEGVLRVEKPRALAFGPDGLYVAAPVIAKHDLGVEGFAGVRPEAYLPQVPDLNVTHFHERRVASPTGSDTRELVVEVANEGTADAWVYPRIEHCWTDPSGRTICAYLRTGSTAPDLLTEGASAVLVYTYDAREHSRTAGDVRIRLELVAAAENDRSDNKGELLTCWKVCGLGFGV